MTNEEIVEQIQNGVDVTANQERLWLKNRGIVYKMIRQKGLKNSDMEDDLAQQGFMGLINAATKYEIGGSAKFLSYAIPFINGAMFRYMGTAISPFHIPQYMRRRIRRYAELQTEARAKGEELTDGQVCEIIGISEDSFRSLQQTMERIRTYSLEDAIPGGDEETSLLETIASDEDVEQLVINGESEKGLHKLLQKALSSLDKRTAEMIKCVYYMNFSKSSIARMMNCSRSYIGTRIERGFRRIRLEYGDELVQYMDHMPEIICQDMEDSRITEERREQEEECNLFLI